MPLILGLLVIAGVAYALSAKYPSGQGPRDALPVGFAGAPKTVVPSLKNTTSGRVYRTESWPANGAGETFHIVFPAGSDAYVSFVANPTSGKRALFRSYGAPEVIAAMKQDFKL